MSEVLHTKRTRQVIDAYRLVNLFRAERGLPRAKRAVAITPRKPKVTRQMVKDICIQVWKDKYPRALTDADFELGELTAKLVEQEVERRIAILKGELIPVGSRGAK